jgi:hypothetical protein
VEEASVSTEGLTSWTASFDGGSGLVGVIVSGDDRARGQRNPGATAGWKVTGDEPAAHNKVDVDKLDSAGLLVEFDDDITEASVTISPDDGSDPDDRQTESSSPFLQFDFRTEGSEYTVLAQTFEANDEGKIVKIEPTPATPEDATDDFYPAGDDEDRGSIVDGDDKTDVDSHDKVTITAITLDGDDAMANLVRIDDGEGCKPNFCYNLVLTGLADGEHEIVYSAVDSAGNELEDEEVAFEKLERSAYEVGLRPGWNLISIPANPSDPAIDSVLPADHPAQTVLSYQNSEWVTAARDSETGAWVGTLTDITAGYGYFVQSNAFDDLATLIPEANPTTQLPVVAVNSGWNLLGVVDVGQEKAGTARDADEYFASIEWSVGYGFDTATNRWDKITKTSDDTVANGSGYWVWATEAGTLVP